MEPGLWDLHRLEHVLPSKVGERGDEAPKFNCLSSEGAHPSLPLLVHGPRLMIRPHPSGEKGREMRLKNPLLSPVAAVYLQNIEKQKGEEITWNLLSAVSASGTVTFVPIFIFCCCVTGHHRLRGFIQPPFTDSQPCRADVPWSPWALRSRSPS